MITKLNTQTVVRTIPLVQPANWIAQYDTFVRLLERGNNRWGMQGVMLAVQGNVIAPLALLIFQYYDFGYQDYFAGLAALLFIAVLVANLALLPVRLTLLIFWISLATQAGLIAYHLLR